MTGSLAPHTSSAKLSIVGAAPWAASFVYSILVSARGRGVLGCWLLRGPREQRARTKRVRMNDIDNQREWMHLNVQ